MTRASRRKRKAERKKRGRPFIENPAPRSPKGRLSRARVAVVARTEEYEHETVSVMVRARMRATGLPEAIARQPLAGNALGLLKYDGKISQAQLEAGNRYAEDMSRYYGLTGVPFPSPRAQNLFLISRGSGGDESPAKIVAARIATTRMMALEGVLLTCSSPHPNAAKSTVFRACVLNDTKARDWPDGTLSYLRRGLSALAEFYGGEK